MPPGTLILCAGPIGNLGDAPPRLAVALGDADVVFAEDTRRTQKLLAHFGIDRPLRSYFAGNEQSRAGELRDRLRAGETVALVTDAGSPAISDPGSDAVRVAVEVGATVTAIPGPSAVTMALGLSGLPADRFVFEGFLPRSGTERSERLGAVAREQRTVVLFCSPNRLGADLADLAALVPDREAVVCRELTKLHEEVWRGSIAVAAAEWGGRDVKGEVTVVLEGGEAPEPDLADAVRRTTEAIDAGERPSAAVKRIAVETGVSRRDLYEAVIGN